jgi:hypothetical protein
MVKIIIIGKKKKIFFFFFFVMVPPYVFFLLILGRQIINNNDYLIACSFRNNDQLYILRNYDDVDPIILKTNLTNLKFEWSNCGNLLAVGGSENNLLKNYIKFFNKFGSFLFKLEIPVKNEEEVFTALTWGHNDERLFIATTRNIHVSIVKKEMASCSLLAHLCLRSSIKDARIIDSLNLPVKLKNDLKQTYKTTIRNIYPNDSELRKFVCTNSKQYERLHCTMKRNSDENNNDFYTLYLEYLGE